MTGATWVNLLYEGLDERDLIDQRVDMATMYELLEWAREEAWRDGDACAYEPPPSLLSH